MACCGQPPTLQENYMATEITTSDIQSPNLPTSPINPMDPLAFQALQNQSRIEMQKLAMQQQASRTPEQIKEQAERMKRQDYLRELDSLKALNATENPTKSFQEIIDLANANFKKKYKDFI
jgi:hypothetical protein